MPDTSFDDPTTAMERLFSEQIAALPIWLQAGDRFILKVTEWALVVVASVFTVIVSFEVASRYLFGFSTYFVNAGSRFLLIWFFLLGAGLALRTGGHIGIELLMKFLGPKARRTVWMIAQILALIFFVEMVFGGVISLGPALRQEDPSLYISLFWAFLAVPVGFALLIYHTVVLVLVEFRKPWEKGVRP